jgi:hypothetical protein
MMMMMMIINEIYLMVLSGTQTMWYRAVENNELAGMRTWLWPQQGTVLPKFEVLIVVSVKIHVFHNMTYQLGKG